ncbi:hypothetical protein EGW08_004936 [Elysia chlorotica]|uniref:Polypeptide N-acetylgalactosaminyltransferase n=1 Tax=Elysia chlorotica TaxID=188477 RepID=A0A3S1BFV6_ELYCH|nr:hypothetical protein EGW08_004936 [Elysia chlorotica]
MKKRKPLNKPALFLIFIISAFLVYQLMWALMKEFYRRSEQKVIFDVSGLKKLLFVNDKITQHLDYSVSKSLSVSYNRDLPDTRHSGCKSLLSNAKLQLPSVSIIITYQEIDISVLHRNIASVVHRSKPVNIKEIILIDDGSFDAQAGKLLQQVQGIKIIRNKSPKGRGVARAQGATVASGEVIVFIDSLSELNVDWLSPLLNRLTESPRSLVSPVFDVIDSDTFEYKPRLSIHKGGIDWSLQFQWIEISSKARSTAASEPLIPFKSPILPGAVFAVRRDFFNWLGKYDVSIGASGVEDIDLSLRAWLCGGKVEIVPCSRAGLIQTSKGQLGVKRVPFSSYLKGAKKVAELWLDDYKRFFYAVRPSARMQTLLNMTISRRLKEKNKCVGFKWFLSTVYPQLLPLVTDEIAFGVIRQQDVCVELDPGQMPLIAKPRPCTTGKDSQEWSWRKKGMIVSNGMCLTSDLGNMHGFVMVQFCQDLTSQAWYRLGLTIVHQESNFCLDSARGDVGLVISVCVQDSPTQTWHVSSETAGPPSPDRDFSFLEEKSQLEFF